MPPLSEEKKAEAEINRIRKLPENKVCANCLTPGNPLLTAVVMKYKIFVCSTCKSAHQSFSHRCKSTQMSVWTMEECRSLEGKNGGGNHVAQATWLARCRDSDRPREGDKLERVKDFVEAPPRRRGDRGSSDVAPAPRMAPPKGSPQPAETIDLFGTDVGPAPVAAGGGFDPNGGFDPSSASMFDPNAGGGCSGSGTSGACGAAQSLAFDPFVSSPAPPAQQPHGGGPAWQAAAPPSGGFNPNAGAPMSAPSASAGGFDDFAFDPFVSAPSSSVAQPAGPAGQAPGGSLGGFDPNGPGGASSFDPNFQAAPAVAAQGGTLGGCGGAAGASGMWGGAGPCMGMPSMAAGAQQGAGDRFAALGGYAQAQQQAPWPQAQQPAPFAAPGGMGQPQSRFAALGAPCGPRPVGPAAGLPPQGAAAQALWGQQAGCCGPAFGAQPNLAMPSAPGAVQQGGFNPSAPATGPSSVQDLQRSLHNLYDTPSGPAGTGPAGGFNAFAF
ncbi:unnamed protein product [Prorocentrum cordatum]|uniref:Arf-GAP domain-containing protein n=1 Tax=Prorocentrum cordatum TaxID=2364126 RepID=A0ABN9UCA9_9DINO|nr:unnamed protein product [Polarella glacialis]